MCANFAVTCRNAYSLKNRSLVNRVCSGNASTSTQNSFVLEIPLQITKDKCNVQNVIVILDMYYYIRLLNPMIRSEFIHHDYLILNQTQNLYF